MKFRREIRNRLHLTGAVLGKAIAMDSRGWEQGFGFRFTAMLLDAAIEWEWQ